MSRVPLRGGGGSRGRSVLLTLVVVVAFAGIAVPAASFTTADVPRRASVAVVDDANGVVGLDTAASVQKESIDRLVSVTNNFDATREFEVTLVENDGDLYLDTDGDGNLTEETSQGTSVTITLDPGASKDVYVEATGDPNTLLEYDVRDTLTSGDEGVRFTLPRDANIDPPGGGGSDPGCKNGKNPNCN